MDYGFESWAQLKACVEGNQRVQERIEALRKQIVADRPLELGEELRLVFQPNQTVRFGCGDDEYGLREILVGLLPDGLYMVSFREGGGVVIGSSDLSQVSSAYCQPAPGIPYLAVASWEEREDHLLVRLRVENDPSKIRSEEVFRIVRDKDLDALRDTPRSIQFFDLLELMGD
jgi:hypothetical protein